MRWSDIGDEVCSVSRSLSVVGDRWSLLIIRSAFLGARRFSDFQSQIGLTKHRLSDRLNKLVENGVFSKVPYQQAPMRYEYRLTKKGVSTYPIILALVKWGDDWLKPEDEAVPMEYIHNTCGNKMTPTLVCPCCSEELKPQDITPVPSEEARKVFEELLEKSKTAQSA